MSKFVPQDWSKPGYGPVAPGYSRHVEAAANAVNEAKFNLIDMLKRAYPLGAEVWVHHHTGHIHGQVTGWDHVGTRILVRNSASGKQKKWWAAQVELIA